MRYDLWVSRLWLLAGAALTIGLGSVYALDPSFLEEAVGAHLLTPEARTEVRSTYGGLHIGIGLFLLLCLRSRSSLREGLLLCGLAFSLAGVARLAGVLEFGAGLPQIGTALLEVGFAGAALWLHRGLASA